MTLHLDPRRRAMLQEMGLALPLLAPRPPAPPADSGAPARRSTASARPAAPAPGAPAVADAPPAPAATALAPASPPLPLPASAPESPAPATSVPMALPAGPWLAAPVAPYAGAGAPQGGGWLVLLECAHPDDPLAGDAGRLLDNMLRAMGLHHQPQTQVAALLAAQPGTAAGTSLAQALQALRPRAVLLLGLGAARAVLGGASLPLARLRASPHLLADGTPASVSHDPAYLLRAPHAKADAWLDLCRALARHPGAAGPGPGH